jgi:hypothetical protein
MITPLPDDLSHADNLLRRAHPTGWQHLGGPMGWFEVLSDEPERGEHGLSVPVKVVGKVGRLVRHFNTHGHFPSRAYIFAGDPGIGKTALVKLMAMTHVAREHEPISYRYNKEERVTLIDDDSGKPLTVNPVEGGGRTFEMVHRAVENTGDSGNQLIESYNTSRLNKPDIDAISNTFNAPNTLYGSRVIYFNEFDNVSSNQVPALKSSLNPGGNIPEDLLVLADTNHLDTVRQSLGGGGIERFEDIHFGTWSYESLAAATDKYLRAFGVEIEMGGFEPKEPPGGGEATLMEGAVSYIAKQAEGSIRAVLKTVSHLAELGRPAKESDVNDIQTSYEGDEDDRSQLFSRYFNVIYNDQTAAGFAANASSRGNSFTSFSAALSSYLLKNRQVLQASETHTALVEMREIAASDAPRPVQWASAVPALRDFAQAIRHNG